MVAIRCVRYVVAGGGYGSQGGHSAADLAELEGARLNAIGQQAASRPNLHLHYDTHRFLSINDT